MAKTHGLANTRTYKIWCGMKSRCYIKSASGYTNYGGRGIQVCDRWRNSFENFIADMGEAPDGMSIDRIDNDGDYEPTNCRWSTRIQQNRNSRHVSVFEGKCISEWAEHYNVCRGTIQKRILQRGTVHPAESRIILFEGKPLKWWAEQLNLSVDTLKQRYYRLNSVYLPSERGKNEQSYFNEPARQGTISSIK